VPFDLLISIVPLILHYQQQSPCHLVFIICGYHSVHETELHRNTIRTRVQSKAVSYTSCLFHAFGQYYGHHISRPSRSPTLYNHISKPPSTKSSFAGIYVLPINNLLSAHESWFLLQTQPKTPYTHQDFVGVLGQILSILQNCSSDMLSQLCSPVQSQPVLWLPITHSRYIIISMFLSKARYSQNLQFLEVAQRCREQQAQPKQWLESRQDKWIGASCVLLL